MRWPDLGAYGLELGVEDTQHGQRLALHSLDGRAVPMAVAKLGFVMVGIGRWVRDDVQLKLTDLQKLFPRVRLNDAPGVPDVCDADPLRPLRAAMRRSYGAGVDVERYHPATPDTCAQLRARAMRHLLGVETVWMRYEGKDPRLDFAGVTLRRRRDKTVFINVDGPFAAAATLGHEAVHVMRREQPLLYADLVAALRPVIDQPAFGRYAARLNRGNAGIEDRVLSLDEVREEAVADIVGDMLLDEQVWRALDDRGLVERLLEFFKAFLQRLAERWELARPALDGTLGSRELLRDLDVARDVVASTLAAWRDVQRPVTVEAAEGMAMAFRTIDGPRPPADLLPQSAVRDADGRLQVVFRGEWGPVVEDAFDSTVGVKLPTFTTSPDVAAVYARGVTGTMPARVRAVALDIRVPLQLGGLDEDIVEFRDLCDRLTASGVVSEQDVRDAWLQLGDRVRHFDLAQSSAVLGERADPDFGTYGYGPGEITDEDYIDTYVIADHPAFVALATRAGYDGFHYLGTFTSPDQFVRPMEEVIAAGYDNNYSATVEWRPFRRDQVVGMFSDAIPEALRSADFRRAYHGSPHAFARPDLAFVLSGEGNNVQGYGFYMADNEAVVADGYCKALSIHHRVFRIGDQLARRTEVEAVAASVFGEDAVAQVANICALLEEGQWRGDLEMRFGLRDEPERTQLLTLLSGIEQIAYGEIADQHVLLSHLDGSRALMSADTSAGYFVARRELSHYLGHGLAVPEARSRAIADQRQSAVQLRAHLADDHEALRLAEMRNDTQALDRVRLRVRDTRWCLREAQQACALLADPRTLVFDVKGMVAPGHLYEGEISDDALMLDWDAVLETQPERVQAALRASGVDVLCADQFDSQRRGMDLYRGLEETLGSAEATSDALMRAGISGVRYLDGASRAEAGGTRTRHYVIWNLEALTEFSMKFQRVFHGTPHRFERFDTAQVGTGEGTQAFGWGVYFAQREDVARFYANRWSADHSRLQGVGEQLAGRALAQVDYDRDAAIAALVDGRDVVGGPVAAASAQACVDAALAKFERGAGQIYAAEVPDDSALLDWDAPMTAQSPDIQSKIQAHDFGGDAVIAAWKRNGAWPYITGETLYRHLAGGLTFGAAAEGRHRDASLALQAIGIPGLRYRDAGSRDRSDGQTSNYVIWDDALIGRAAPSAMQFRRRETASERPFYSALLDAIERGRDAPRAASADAWAGWLDGAQRRGEYRQVERDWLEVDIWLRAQPGPVTRDALATFVREHQVGIQEVLRGHAAAGDPVGGSRHAKCVEPGGERYRELLLLMLPSASANFVNTVGDLSGYATRNELANVFYDRALIYSREEASRFVVGAIEGIPAPLAKVRETIGADVADAMIARAKKTEQEAAGSLDRYSALDGHEFRTSHFDQPNILAHVRFNERSTVDGQRVLFLEEIQSDWHQQGRKQGYAYKAVAEDDVWATRTQDGRFMPADDRHDFPAGSREAAEAPARTLTSYGQRVPDAPFKGTEEWVMLALKRMVRWAAEHGFDGVAWTGGEQQVQRYSIDGKVAEATVLRTADGWQVGLLGADGRWIREAGTVPTVDELTRYLGKEAAEQAQALPEGERRDFAHLNREFGGEGIRTFYDRILPQTVNKWLRQYGAAVNALQVGMSTDDDRFEIVLPNGKVVSSSHTRSCVEGRAKLFDGAIIREADPSERQLGFLITPMLREAALEGLPLFRRKQADNVIYLRDANGNLVVQAKTRPAAPVPPDAAATPCDEADDDAFAPALAARF